nr:lysine--tRNA ligase [Bacilli bacterium]
GAKGTIITTQTGEKSLEVEELTFLGKALRPLPEKFHGLQDTEIKYRERYVDLIMNQDSRELFLGRSKFYYFLRNFMHDNGFLEVETPIVQTAVSGASAKPFFTHHNALDIDCNLRIAPECYLKECNAAGFDRVYEVAKCFRNEGMDPQHLQEFTQIEWYASYWNFEDNIKFFQDFMRKTALYLKNTTEITIGDRTIDLGKDWNRINYVEALTEALGFDFINIEDPEELRSKIIESGKFSAADLVECSSVAQLIDFCYKRLVRANIFEPTIMWNYPAVLKPLARRNDDNNKVVDVFQVIIAGAEICNAYSELVNPEVQRANFEDQLKQKAQGDDETMDLDEDYLKAMEQGMPPISGLGVGIDRLMMLLYNAESVRDVVLFPMMKPENK